MTVSRCSFLVSRDDERRATSAEPRATSHEPRATMEKTYGLTHVALAVRDVDRASAFYRSVFGAVEVYRQNGFVQLQTPGARDVIVLEKKAKGAGKSGGIAHFGFRLRKPQ